ncbi:hypothetical protein D8S78_05075 [Natrialba swarupiae]|nr:hypothetical protein [Natrialba swarupiae]
MFRWQASLRSSASAVSSEASDDDEREQTDDESEAGDSVVGRRSAVGRIVRRVPLVVSGVVVGLGVRIAGGDRERREVGRRRFDPHDIVVYGLRLECGPLSVDVLVDRHVGRTAVDAERDRRLREFSLEVVIDPGVAERLRTVDVERRRRVGYVFDRLAGPNRRREVAVSLG